MSHFKSHTRILIIRTHFLSLLCLITLGSLPVYTLSAQGSPDRDSSSRKENTLTSPQWPAGAYTLVTSPENAPVNSPLTVLIRHRDETTFWVSLPRELWVAKQIGQGAKGRLEPLEPKRPTIVFEQGKGIYFLDPLEGDKRFQAIASPNIFTLQAPEWVQKALYSLEKTQFFELEEAEENFIFNRDKSLTFSGPLLQVNDKKKKTCDRLLHTLAGWSGAAGEVSRKLKQGVFAISVDMFKDKLSDCTEELSITQSARNSAGHYLVVVDSKGAVEVVVAIGYMEAKLFVREEIIADASFKKRLEKLLFKEP